MRKEKTPRDPKPREPRPSVSVEEAVIYGINPVLEALRAKRLNKVFLAPGRGGQEVDEIRTSARQQRATVQTVPRDVLDRMAKTAKHQGVVGLLSAQSYTELDEILQGIRRRGEPAFLLVLDEVEDPRNLGAIIRTADAVGVHGVIIPERRAAGLTGVVSKTSAGAVVHVPVARVVNISATIDRLKKENIWTVGIEAGRRPLIWSMISPIRWPSSSERKEKGSIKKCSNIAIRWSRSRCGGGSLPSTSRWR